MKRLLLCVVCVLLSGCGTPLVATPAPTPQAISIFYPASLKPWADKLANCATDSPALALYFFQGTNLEASTALKEIDLVLGQPPKVGTGSSLYQVGWEQLVVIVNKENSLAKLTADLLRQIFSGKVDHWQKSTSQSIQVWVLPEGEPTRQVFEQGLGSEGLLAPNAKLAPDPLAVLKMVAEDENAIGYLPRTYISDPSSPDASHVKTVELDQALEQAFHQPVIAITKGEPTTLERNLLACIQTTSP